MGTQIHDPFQRLAAWLTGALSHVGDVLSDIIHYQLKGTLHMQLCNASAACCFSHQAKLCMSMSLRSPLSNDNPSFTNLYEQPQCVLEVGIPPGSPLRRGQQLGRPSQGVDGCIILLQLEAAAAKPHPSLSIAGCQLQCSHGTAAQQELHGLH